MEKILRQPKFSYHDSTVRHNGRAGSTIKNCHSKARNTFRMLIPIFTYCGYNSLGWSESRKRMICSIETRSLEIILPKCSLQNYDLRFLTIDNFLRKRACCFVFDCLNGTVCYPFKDYFQRLYHNALNTRNNGKIVKLPKVKLDFARRSFYFLGASIFNSLPLSLRNNNSRVLFRKALDDHYL